MKYENLEKALTDLGWFLLTDEVGYSTLLEIFNPEQLNDQKQPTITTKTKTVLVLDNNDWNETYLIDLVSEQLKKQYPNIKPGYFDLVYCNDICNRTFVELQRKIVCYSHTDEETKDIERKELHPMVFVINPEYKCLVALKEQQLNTITEREVTEILKFLDDDFCKDNMKE